jgi:hypothetical protein
LVGLRNIKNIPALAPGNQFRYRIRPQWDFDKHPLSSKKADSSFMALGSEASIATGNIPNKPKIM